MKIVFMGTPEFAVTVLEALFEKHTVAAAVTQPDKAAGRGKQVQQPPVKAFAVRNDIPVFQPSKIRDPENIKILRQWQADMFVVAAYGQILPTAVLTLPRFGCINVHASLLPKYRGAAPVQHAILRGETETGVTIMQMDKGIDTGDMFLKRAAAIEPEDTYGDLQARLARTGAEALLTVLDQIENGRARPEPQNPDEATYAPMITGETGEILWEKSCREIADLIRGLNPAPGAYTFYGGSLLKLWKAEPAEQAAPYKNALPGEIIEGNKQGLFVHTGGGVLRILEIQEKGGRKMPAADYLRGHPLRIGAVLGRGALKS